jgi:hypothetical protein
MGRPRRGAKHGRAENVAGLRGVHEARSKEDEKPGFGPLRAEQLRSRSNARSMRRIAAAERDALHLVF